jgi:hypothetical protein
MLTALLWLALAPATGSTTAPAPTTSPSLDTLRIEARAEVEQELASLPTLPPRFRRDVFRLSVEDGLLKIRPLLPQQPTRPMVVVPLRDWPGVTTLSLQGVDDPRQQSMMFTHRGFNSPGMVVEYTHVIAGPTNTQIARDSEGPSVQRSVQLVQNIAEHIDPDQALRLYVREIDVDLGATRVDLNLPAASLEELRREHPDVVRKYLQPILDDLGFGGGALGVTRESALQVIAPDVPADPQLEARIDRLLAQLDSDDFAQRQRAAQALADTGHAGAVVLLRRDLSKLPAEPRAAVESFIAPFAPFEAAQVVEMRRDPDFLAEAILVLDKPFRAAALRRLETVLGRKVALDLDAGEDKLAEQVGALRRELHPTTRP